MRAASIHQPRFHAGTAMIVAGGLLLALALALLVLDRPNDGSAIPAATSSGAYATTNAEVAFWEARAKGDLLDFVAFNHLAQAYMQRGRETGDVSDYSRAEAAVTASLRALPGDNESAVALRASLQNTKHEFQDALVTAQRAIALDASDPYVIGVLGDAQAALGEYDAAYQTFDTLVARSPGLSSFSRLAYIQELRGETEGAELAWRNALGTDNGRSPENTAWARVQYGNFEFSRGDAGKAEDQYNESLRALPGYVYALAGLAKVHAAQGDYEQAVALYTQVTQRRPLPEYVAALGDVYTLAGRPRDAAEQYALIDVIGQLYRANGINTDLQMALFLADHDTRLDEALTQAQAIYGKQPASIYTADAMSWALYKNGRYQEALGYSRQALRLGTRDASLLFHAGMISYELDDYTRARDLLAQALDVNPHFSLLYARQASDTLAQAMDLAGNR